MFIKRTKRTLRGKTYTNHLLVESVATERGPRHRVVCSLGALSPAPKAQWLKLAHHLQQSLSGQESLLGQAPQDQALVQKAAVTVTGRKKRGLPSDFDLEEVEVEEARLGGAVHVGHQIWQRLGLDQILAQVGFSHKTCLLTQLMTLNRLIEPSSELAMSEWVGRSALADILTTGLYQAQGSYAMPATANRPKAAWPRKSSLAASCTIDNLQEPKRSASGGCRPSRANLRSFSFKAAILTVADASSRCYAAKGSNAARIAFAAS